jgi:hypothetical protein
MVEISIKKGTQLFMEIPIIARRNENDCMARGAS